jgi:hypothetical protein
MIFLSDVLSGLLPNDDADTVDVGDRFGCLGNISTGPYQKMENFSC